MNSELELLLETAKGRLGTSAEPTGALLQLCSALSKRLADEPPATFAHDWFLREFASEWLRYSIEDDYVNLATVNAQAVSALRELLTAKDWLTPKLESFADYFRVMADQKPLRYQRVELRAPTRRGAECCIVGRLSPPDQPAIPVSSDRFPFVPLLEESLGSREHAQGIARAYAERLAELGEQEGATCLGFIEKNIGPVGALALCSDLVDALDLPACVYRAGHWPRRAKFAAYEPQRTDRVLLAYDLLVRGDGIREAARSIEAYSGAKVIGAVVLYAYGEKRSIVETEGVGTPLKLDAIAWHADFAAEVESIQRGAERTAHLTTLTRTNGRSSCAPAVRGGRKGASASSEGESMETLKRWKWPQSVTQYRHRDLRAVEFASVAEAKRAIKLCWEDPDLEGMPYDIANGRTLIVPEEGVSLLREHQLQFVATEVLSPGDLAPEALREYRLKHAM